MEYKLEDLIDIPLLQTLQDKLNEINSFPSALIDNNGKVLTATAWQDICTKFHRSNPESEKVCIISDKIILGHIQKANPAVSYKCPHGMVDSATPIIIDGKHLGNFFTGQLFLEKPDMKFFKKQAKKYEFDEREYLEAVTKVPVWTQKQLDKYLDFIKSFAEELAYIGLTRLKEIETKKIILDREEKYKNLFDTANDALLLVDQVTGKILEANISALNLYGYSLYEILQLKDIDLSPEPTNAFRSNEKKIELQYHIKKDRTVFPVEISASYFTLNDRNVCIIAIRNITKRIKAEQALKESEEIFKHFMENSPIYVFFKDENIRALRLSRNYEKMLGKPLNEILGKTMDDLFPSELAKNMIADDQKILHEEKLITVDEELNGRYYTTIKFPILIEGKPRYLAGYTIDNTEQKIAEVTLRESEENFRTIFENNSSAMAIINQDTTISTVNDAYCQMSGYIKDEVIGMSWTQHIPPEDLERLKDYYRRRLVDVKDTPEKFEFKFYKKNGDIRHGLMSIALIQSNQKIIASFIDITERKQAELQLEKYAEGLSISNAAKDKFFSIIAHDLRSPFHPLLSIAELFENDIDSLSTEEIKIFAKDFNTQLKNQFHLLENLLSWSILQNDKMDFVLDGIDLFEITQNVKNLFKTNASNKNIDLLILIDRSFQVLADQNMLFSILQNLISNSVKFSYPNSKVIIEAKEKDNFIEISVIDNGQGIPADAMDKIFHIDAGYSTLGTKNEKGTGLGLSICKEMVEKQNGKIWVESVVGKGTTFSFTLPKK
ncbi:MAG: PAS domain S-box protein [Ignavibacteriales bacterium]|nr:PAS domain S-box protein [Ignavibacteriales bacterium]